MVVSGIVQVREHAVKVDFEDDMEIDDGSVVAEGTDEDEVYGPIDSEK